MVVHVFQVKFFLDNCAINLEKVQIEKYRKKTRHYSVNWGHTRNVNKMVRRYWTSFECLICIQFTPCEKQLSFYLLAFSWRTSLLYRNQSKSMHWFLYDRDLCYERVKVWFGIYFSVRLIIDGILSDPCFPGKTQNQPYLHLKSHAFFVKQQGPINWRLLYSGGMFSLNLTQSR